MGFTFKGKQVSNINFNGAPLNTLQFRGVIVWQAIEDLDFLCFEAVEDTTVKVMDNEYASKIQYSSNKGKWTSFTYNTPVSIPAGTKLYIKGDITGHSNVWNALFSLSGQVDLTGNIMSLIDPKLENTNRIPNGTTFEYLFMGNTALRHIHNLKLPAMILSESCYKAMFANCTNIDGIPTLPATDLVWECYATMFYGCRNIIRVDLPAVNYAYRSCFRMFYECSSLSSMRTYADDNYSDECTLEWLYGVSSSGTFGADGTACWKQGPDGVPYNWYTNAIICEEPEPEEKTYALTDEFANDEHEAGELFGIYKNTPNDALLRDWNYTFINSQYDGDTEERVTEIDENAATIIYEDEEILVCRLEQPVGMRRSIINIYNAEEVFSYE